MKRTLILLTIFAFLALSAHYVKKAIVFAKTQGKEVIYTDNIDESVDYSDVIKAPEITEKNYDYSYYKRHLIQYTVTPRLFANDNVKTDTLTSSYWWKKPQ